MNITVSWIDGEHGNEVEVPMTTEEGAFELARNVSVGGDATVEFDDDYTVQTIKFEDGRETERDTTNIRHVIGNYLFELPENGGLSAVNSINNQVVLRLSHNDTKLLGDLIERWRKQ